MDINTLITVISIMVAVYALLPRATLLALSLKVVWFDWLFITLLVLILHYILFLDMFMQLGWVPEIFADKRLQNYKEVPYFLLIFSLFFLILRFQLFSVPARKLDQLHKLAEELLATKHNHAQLISILAKNLNKLNKLCHSESWSTKFRRLLASREIDMEVLMETLVKTGKLPSTAPKFGLPIFQIANVAYLKYVYRRLRNKEEGARSLFPLLQKENIEALKSGMLKMLAVPARWLPQNEEKSSKACDILALTLTNRDFVNSISSIRPYFAISVLQHDLRVSYKFSDRYLTSLMLNTDSVLYIELENNQNMDKYDDYYIPPRNKLLGFLFNDAKVAEKYGVWKPIGEVVISDLEKRHLAPEKDNYNYPLDDFKERQCWESEIYVGIRFFDLMVRKAIVQNITWHMWLYYFTHFVEKICDNFKKTYIEDDYFGEWPTRYCFLLYEIISSLRAWICMVENLNFRQENLRLEAEENGNPVKSSIIVLSMCLCDVANCKEIPDRFKRNLIEMALGLYFQLKQSPKTEAYSKYLFEVLINGGRWERADEAYLGTLLQTFVYQDNLHYELDHVVECMAKIINSFRDKWGLAELKKYLDIEEHANTVVLKSRHMHYTVELL